MKFDYEYYTLKNGLRVFLMPSDTVYSATITATVKTGSCHETDELSGITHFIEHVSLAATKSWPTRYKLTETREFNGAKYNGSTGRETLDYWINIPYNKINFGFQYIYEVLYECTLNPEYIEQERGIVLDEISKRCDNPGYENIRFITENLNKMRSGYLRDIAGTKKTVSKYSIEDIKTQYKKLHSPNKVMISVVGNFDTKKVKRLIENLFGKQEETDKQQEFPQEGVNKNITKIKHSPKTDLIFTSIEFPSLSANDTNETEKNYVDLMFSILCGPMSSRLVKRLREEENLLYGISADHVSMETFGLTSVYYGIPVKNFEKAFKITVEELEKFYEKGTNKKELDHYKEYFSNRYLVNYDNVFSFSKLFRGALFWGNEPLDLEETIKVVKESTPTDINKMIHKFIGMENINAFGFGNVNEKTEMDMKKILKKYL